MVISLADVNVSSDVNILYTELPIHSKLFSNPPQIWHTWVWLHYSIQNSDLTIRTQFVVNFKYSENYLQSRIWYLHTAKKSYINAAETSKWPRSTETSNWPQFCTATLLHSVWAPKKEWVSELLQTWSKYSEFHHSPQHTSPSSVEDHCG